MSNERVCSYYLSRSGVCLLKKKSAFRSLILVCLCLTLVMMPGYAVFAAPIDRPSAAGGEESVTASNFTPGATLKLYLTNGVLVDTSPSGVFDPTYEFSNVVPNSLGFYVTQIIGSDESANSDFVGVSLRTPAIAAGIGYVDVSNVLQGATAQLYEADGTPTGITPSDQGGGVWRFEGLTPRADYYAVQSINNVISLGTNLATVLPDVPDAPATIGGEESIQVNSFTSGATLKLYLWNGTLVDTATSVTDSSYTFTNVVPNSIGFYVTQTVGSEESINSAFTSVSLRTPAIAAGIGYVDVSNVLQGATAQLYEADGTPTGITPSDQGGGVWRFEGLTPRADYYAVQSINNVISLGTNLATVLPDVPDAPATIGGEESIQVNSFTSGATLKLYLWNGTLVDTATSVTDSSYTFTNVVPNSIGFYVTQTVGSEESVNSAFTPVSLRAPVAIAGEDYVDVSNVLQGAQVELYDSGDNLVSSSPQEMNDGAWRFAGLQTRKSYYAIQSINGVTSSNSVFVTINPDIPAAPSAAGGEEHIVASGYEEGATLKLYLTDQTLLRTIPNVVGSTYMFEDVVPNHLGFYVTQTVGGEESENSIFTDVSLRTPEASGGVRYVDISNVLEGASLALYDSNHTLITAQPVDLGNGVWRFNELSNGLTYYAIQSINGVVSLNTLFVTLPEPPSQPLNVAAVAGNGQAVISFTPPLDSGRSPISEYRILASPGGEIVASGTASPITVTGLSNGTSYTFKVIAVNETGAGAASEESNAVVPWVYSYVNNSMSSFDVEVIVNGKSEPIGRAFYGFENGRSLVRIVANRSDLEKRLASEGDRPSIIVPVQSTHDIAIGEFDGELIRSMQLKQATIELRTPDASYRLPTSEIPLDEIIEVFGSGVSLADITFKIETSAASREAIARVENAARNGSFTVAAPPREFALYASYGGKTHELTGFNVYVERTIHIPASADPSRITTGIVVEADGTVRHVPTRVVVNGSQYTAVINSLTNSTYAVVWNPVAFTDMIGHWAQNSVNDMGSRMVIGGTGDGVFNPEREMTRAEFAEMLVKGLGLRVEKGAMAAQFNDVDAADWFSGAIHSAVSYKLLQGYEDGSFRPEQRITREQATVILAKAMLITGLTSSPSSGDDEAVLQEFGDAGSMSGWAKQGVVAAMKAGIIVGKSSDRLAPKDYLTRAEAAVMIQRLLRQSDLIDK